MVESPAKPEVTIVLPCLNEAETLQNCLNDAKSWIKARGISAEILVSDNGSHDGSVRIAKDNMVKVINVKTKGYGAALRHGIEAASGKLVIHRRYFGGGDGGWVVRYQIQISKSRASNGNNRMVAHAVS